MPGDHRSRWRPATPGHGTDLRRQYRPAKLGLPRRWCRAYPASLACYKSRLWHDTCTELGVTVKRTRPYRPQTNGKVERFHRTLADEWAYAKAYTSEKNRRKALPGWLHTYNHHRLHSAIGGPPASRVPNLSGQNT